MTKQALHKSSNVESYHSLQPIAETSHLTEASLQTPSALNGSSHTATSSRDRGISTSLQEKKGADAPSPAGNPYLLKQADNRERPLRIHSEKRRPADSGFASQQRRGSFPPIPLPKIHQPEAVPQPKQAGSSLVAIIDRMRVREKTLLGYDLSAERSTATDSKHKGPSIASQTYFLRTTSKPEGRAGDRFSQSNDSDRDLKRNPYSEAERFGLHAQSQGNIKEFSDRKPEVSQYNGGSAGAALHSCNPEDPSQTFNDPSHEQHELLTSSAATRDHQQGNEDEYESDFDSDGEEEKRESPLLPVRLSNDTKAVYQTACVRLRVQSCSAFLKQCKHAVAQLNDIRMGPADVKPIAISLVRDSHLCILDLSHNNLGALGVGYIAEMLQENKSIIDLNLSATNPGPEGIRALSETLRHNRSLTVLRLEENRIEHTESQLLAAIIKTAPSLRSLHLGHNRLGYNGGSAIAEAIAHNNSLGTLDLQWNHIRRDSAASLARALGTNKGLHTFNVAWNGLGREGCLALAYALPKNRSLRELDLTCNRIDLRALSFLMKGVVGNRGLRTLKVGQNPLTTEGAKAMLNALTSTPSLELREIDISGVPVDQAFLDMVKAAQETRVLRVKHEEAITMATSDQKREHDPTNLSRFDPIMVLFEYMKLDNLRVIDMFQFMDTRKRDKLSRNDVRDGLNTLKIPLTEYALDVIMEKLDLNKDGFVELDEMMKGHRETMRLIKLRTIKARAKNREDESLHSLRQTLRDVIKKRKEENESRRDSVSVAKTTGGRKASVGGTGLMASLQLTQTKHPATTGSNKPGRKSLPHGDDGSSRLQAGKSEGDEAA